MAASRGSQAVSDSLRSSSASAQAAITRTITGEGESGFILQVKQKLKKLPPFNEAGDNELTDEAQRLTDPHRIFEVFSHLVADRALEGAVEEVLDDDVNDLGGPLELTHFRDREQQRLGRAVNLPVILYLRELSVTEKQLGHSVACFGSALLRTEYGPVHAMIKVGDVVLEWDSSNLVVPHRQEAPLDDGVVLRADVRRGSDVYQRAKESLDPNRPPLTQGEEIDRLFSSSQEMVERIKQLSELIAKYNRKYYYNVISRNCQTFVDDALKALEIQRPEFTGIMEEHFQQVRKGNFGVPRSFATHEDLDAYVMKLQENGLLPFIEFDDLQFLLQAYLQHHKEQRCERPTCKVNDLEVSYRERMQTV